jgi:hypothetical protein
MQYAGYFVPIVIVFFPSLRQASPETETETPLCVICGIVLADDPPGIWIHSSSAPGFELGIL